MLYSIPIFTSVVILLFLQQLLNSSIISTHSRIMYISFASITTSSETMDHKYFNSCTISSPSDPSLTLRGSCSPFSPSPISLHYLSIIKKLMRHGTSLSYTTNNSEIFTLTHFTHTLKLSHTRWTEFLPIWEVPLFEDKKFIGKCQR